MSEHIEPIPSRLYNAAVGGHVAGADQIIDDNENKEQSQINAEVKQALGEGGSVDEKIAEEAAKHYLKSETYNKTELNNMITTPNQVYETYTATDQTTAATDVLPATGSANTVYRVGNWDGIQYNDSVFSEYAWNGSTYIKLSTKSQIGEIYDISANHADTKYADLFAALGTNGANIPQSLRNGGMSVKFVQTSDNKYVQYFCNAQLFTTDIDDWKKINLEDEVTQLNINVGDAWKLEYAGRIANGKWWNDFPNYKHTIIPICGGDVVKLVPSINTYYTVLKDYPSPVAGDTPEFATGYSDRVPLLSTQSFVAPGDAKWLYVQVEDYGTSDMPQSIIINNNEVLVEHSTSNAIGKIGQKVLELETSTIKETDINISVVSKNIADPSLIQDGKFIGSNGGIGSDDSWSLIKIPVKPNTTYTFGGFYLGRTGYCAFYNVSDALISFESYDDPNGRETPKSVTTPNNTAFLYIDIKINQSPSDAYSGLQVNEGYDLLFYDSFEEAADEITGYGISAKDTELRSEYDVQVLRNPERLRQLPNAGYVKYSDGTLNNGGYVTSNFIKVNEKDTISVVGIHGSSTVAVLAAYSSNQESSYIKEKSVVGVGGDTSFDYVVPNGISYIRLCCNAEHLDNFSYGIIPYVPYVPDSLIAKDTADSNEKIATMGILREFNSNKGIIRLYPQTKLPCVSFQFDDIPTKDSEIVTLFESFGLTCAFAFIASVANIDEKGETYLNYQRRGFQIMNHSINGNPFNLTNYNYQTALEAICTALNRIQEVGMVCNGFVAPSSTMESTFMPILKMFHAYAFTSATTSATSNSRSQNTCDLHRYSLQSNTLEQIKQYIDDCITNDQIMTFYGHAADLVDGDTTVFSLAKIAAVIQYCIAKRDAGLLYLGGTDDCVKYFFDL